MASHKFCATRRKSSGLGNTNLTPQSVVGVDEIDLGLLLHQQPALQANSARATPADTDEKSALNVVPRSRPPTPITNASNISADIGRRPHTPQRAACATIPTAIHRQHIPHSSTTSPASFAPPLDPHTDLFPPPSSSSLHVPSRPGHQAGPQPAPTPTPPHALPPAPRSIPPRSL